MYSIYALKGKGINVESFVGRNLVEKTFDYLYFDSKGSMLDWFIVLYVSCLGIIKELLNKLCSILRALIFNLIYHLAH